MKKIICFFVIACLLIGGSACSFADPAEALYKNLSTFTPAFDLWTDNVSELFTEVLGEYPELQVYVGQVKTSGSRMRQTVNVTYQNTDIPREMIRVGSAADVAVSALKETMDAVAARGVTVLLGCNDQPDPQVWLDTLAKEYYLSYMGHTDTGWTFYNNDFTEDTVVVCQVQYSMDAATLSDYRQKSAAEIQRLSALLWDADTAPEARVLAIHDHLIKNADYAQVSTSADHTPYNILLEGRGVCDGYAYAAKLLLDAAGIENRIISGTAGGADHRWNLVKLNENWYHMDITWDDPISPDGTKHHTYDYYLKGDATMRAEHDWNEQYPACKQDYTL